MSSVPLISVIIAVYNRAQTLEQSIVSFVNQTYHSKELIIIDGESSDGSVDIIRKYDKQISYWVSEPDKGIYDAWNKALVRVKGDWVIFLGADDYFWDERVLEKAAGYISNLKPNVGIFYGVVNMVNYEGDHLFTVYNDWAVVKKELKYHLILPHPGAFHRRWLFEQYGFFDDSFKLAGDYDFLLRVLEKEEAYSCKDLTVKAMRYGGISSSFRTARLKLKEDYLAKKKNGISVFNFYMLNRIFVTYGRELLVLLLGINKTDKLERSLRKIIKKQYFWDKL